MSWAELGPYGAEAGDISYLAKVPGFGFAHNLVGKHGDEGSFLGYTEGRSMRPCIRGVVGDVACKVCFLLDSWRLSCDR